MAEQTQFGQKPEGNPGGLRCEEWELLLADALDGQLAAKEAAAFATHSAGCAGCADLLAHAKQGREWLEYLHTEPEIPSGLVGKILDRTVGAGSVPLPVVAGTAQGTSVGAVAMPWRRNFHEMRLLMTVAMAFFSIALTLNLAGVRLSSVRLADLRPSTIGSALSRQFYGAQGQVVRFYENLRFVYQMESRMRELRRDVDTTSGPQQKKSEPAKPNRDKDGSLNPGPARGAVLNAAQRAESSGFGARYESARIERGLSNENIASDESIMGTETNNWVVPGHHKAGPRRNAEIAGYEGRSLA